MSVTSLSRPCSALVVAASLLAPLVPGAPLAAQDSGLPPIAEQTEGMQRIEGLLPLYYDEAEDELHMEIGILDTEILHSQGLAAGLGSNDIGLDRGGLQGSRIVSFERHGSKILMVQPNYDFRAISDNPAEVKAVRDAFARSVLWSFDVEAQTGDRVLVDVTDFLFTDHTNIGNRMGGYRLETSRSSLYMPMTQGFPQNTEMEVELTFVPGGGGGGGRGGFFEGVGSVAATSSAASLRVHHSFIVLPDPTTFETRAYDPRAGYGGASWDDYAVPLEEELTQRFIRRHRLEKVDPNAAVSDAVEPIVYYLDPGAPEPIRSALLDGARWWADAFEAAGYRNAFRVEILPEDASPLDVRYNVINWVHRSTRGWSSGASVTDPRTGEILKATVTLGSLRWRQDYMIAEGLLSPYQEGNEPQPEIAEWALARIRQLSAHEVGHTLGLGHNYYNSDAGRISVMDYPHPLVTLESDGSLDFSDVYDVGIAEWDSVAIAYGYSDFPSGTDEDEALQEILDEAWEEDVRYLTNQDIGTHPHADQWVNGADATAELNRLMDLRSASLERFGVEAIKTGMPMATIEEVLVPLYLHHRYAIESTASALGGVDYIYAFRGDGRNPYEFASGATQRAALDALMRTLDPAELAIPRRVIDAIPPRPSGYGSHRELFPRQTGSMFDVVTPATVVADMTVGEIFQDSRAARLVEQRALDPSIPSLGAVIDRVWSTAFDATPADDYQAEISRAVEGVVVDRLIGLAAGADMPQVRAVAMQRLERGAAGLRSTAGESEEDAAHYAYLAGTIERFLEDPSSTPTLPGAPGAPPGAPIGDPGMDFLGSGGGWPTGAPGVDARWRLGAGTGLGASALPPGAATRWLDSFGVLCTWDQDNGGG